MYLSSSYSVNSLQIPLRIDQTPFSQCDFNAFFSFLTLCVRATICGSIFSFVICFHFTQSNRSNSLEIVWTFFLPFRVFFVAYHCTTEREVLRALCNQPLFSCSFRLNIYSLQTFQVTRVTEMKIKKKKKIESVQRTDVLEIIVFNSVPCRN